MPTDPQQPQVVTTAKAMLNSGAISATQYAALLAKIGWQNEGQLIAAPAAQAPTPGAPA